MAPGKPIIVNNISSKYKTFLTEKDELSLTLFLNYNEDRQLSRDLNINYGIENLEKRNFVSLETIGMHN